MMPLGDDQDRLSPVPKMFALEKASRLTEIQIGNKSVGLLGDPHLGRAFVRGVPLEKRGLREQMVMNDFRRRMQESGQYDVHVCMGDLFDKWAVPYGVVFEAALAYLTAARANPGTEYVVIAGNHDVSRDLEKKGALDLFELATRAEDNIRVARHTDNFIIDTIGGVEVGFFPFHPTIPAAELVVDPIAFAFGHWDTLFGHDNMIPTEKLAEMGCKTAYTGHIHLPDRFTRDGVEVVQVGSMQPYAHGEDRGEMYVTLRPDEIAGQDLSQKCVRVLLERGETFTEAVDCLQLTFKREGANEDDESEEVSLGEFDLLALFRQAFEEAGVPDHVRNQITERFEGARLAE